jgi:hypothetical protein
MSHWIIETKQGELRIKTFCMESWPCQHINNMKLDSVAIWRLIKQMPELQHEQPKLWLHFSVYNDRKFDDWEIEEP